MASSKADATDGIAGDDRAHRLILRGGGSAAAGFVVRFAARLLFLLIAARLFGAALFGAYSLAVAVVELGAAAGVLGMKRLLFQLLDEDRSGRAPAHLVLDAAFAVGAVSLSLAAAILLALAVPPVAWAAGETGAALRWVAPMIAGQALLDLILAATRWRQRMRYEVVARSLVEPYAALAATALAWFAGLRESGLLVGYWAGTLLALAYAVAGARRCFGSFGLAAYRMPRGRLRQVIGIAAVPTASDCASALFARLDLYLVGLMLGEAPAGIYNVARQVRTPVRQIRQSFDGMLTPIVARTLAARGPAATGRALASAARLILAFQLPALVGLAVIGLPLLHWFGPEFAAGYWALVLLAAAETIQGAFGVGDLILLYRRPLLVLRLTLVAAAVNLAAGWLLIGPLGVTGAALSVLVAMVAGALLRRHSLRFRFGVDVPLLHSAGPVAAACVAAAAAGAILWLAPLPEAAGAGAALAAALSVYAAALRLWLRATGDRLALVEFSTGQDADRTRKYPPIDGRAQGRQTPSPGAFGAATAFPIQPDKDRSRTMKATIYHNPKCGTSRKTLEALQASGADVTVIEYLKTPPSKAELKRLYEKAGISPREGLRAREPLAQDLDLVDGAVSDNAILEAMVENPILIERPLVETDKGVRLCRPQERVNEIL